MFNKDILLTFDYELFLGEKTGSIENCLLIPTDRILEVFKETGLKGTFFVDVIFCQLLKTQNPELFEKVKVQLQKIIQFGSRIELHLHPHWLDSTYSNNTWSFPSYNRYCLDSFTEDEITNLFINGVKFLHEIASDVVVDYKIIAFRAGGFAISPFNKIVSGFKKANIIFDSSVSNCLEVKHDNYLVKFPKIIESKYFFETDPINDRSGSFTEIPITTYEYRLIDKVINKLIRNRKLAHPFGDGVGMSYHVRLSSKFKTVHKMFSLDYMNCTDIKKYIKCKKDLINVISHPKSMTQDSINMLYLISREKLKSIDFTDLL